MRLYFIYIFILVFLISNIFFFDSFLKEKIGFLFNNFDFQIKSDNKNKKVEIVNYTEWFGIDKSIAKDYEIKISEDKNKIIIRKFKNNYYLNSINLHAIYFKRSSAYDIAIGILIKSLENLYNVSITVYYVDYNLELTNNILKEISDYNKHKKHIVLSFGSDTTDYLFSISQNYENINFVSITSKDPKTMGYVEDFNSTTNKNFALTSLNMPSEIQYQYIRKFFKKLDKLIILVDAQNKSSFNTQYLPLKKLAERDNIKVYPVLVNADQKNPNDINEKFEKELLKVKNALNSDGYDKNSTLIIMTGSTILFERYNIINKIIPDLLICSMIPDQTIGKYEDTASFGIGVTFQKNASIAAKYILRILSGEDPGKLPIGFVFPPDVSINITHFQNKGFYIPEELLLTSTLVYS